MDSERFDGLVRSFGQTRSRRQTLRGLAGVLATGVFALSVPEVNAARCSASSPCPECSRCRRHRCRKRADDYPCTGGTCQGGTCALCNPHATPCGLDGVPCCSGTCSAGGDMPGCPRGADLCCD